MRLGASINLFDNEESIKPLLLNIRPYVDCISITYQLRSNWGVPAAPYLMDLLHDLKRKGLVDNLIPFVKSPTNTPAMNEVKKRNIGLNDAKNNKCTHFISFDADEFYKPDEFVWAKEMIKEHKVLSTFCHIQDYYKSPEYKVNDLANYFVPFIYQIENRNTCFTIGKFKIPLVDPTRQITNNKMAIFKPEEMVMHHMTTVRATYDNLLRKFDNSTARGAWDKEGGAKAVTDRIWNYDFLTNNNLHNSLHPVTLEVSDCFNINKNFEEYRRKYS